MSDIQNSKLSPLEWGKSITIGKLRWTRLRFNALLEKYRQPVANLQAECSGTSVTVDAYGHPRVVAKFNEGGLAQAESSGSSAEENTFVEEFARAYLERALTKAVLDSTNATLSFSKMTALPNTDCWIVAFQESIEALQQQAEGTSSHSRCDVDKSRVEVLMRKSGDSYEICRLTSSLARPATRQSVEFAVSESQALAIAEKAMRRKLCQYKAEVTASSCQAQANLYRWQLVPIYRFVLSLQVSKRSMSVEVIVRGDNGKVVFAKPEAMHAGAGVAGKALLNVPNRYQAIASQMKDVIIDTSILRQVDGKYVLANQWVEVHSCQLDENGRRSTQLVTTMPDDGTANGGTFNWPENTPQAKAVAVYVAYMFEINLAIECGLKIPQGIKVLLVNAADPWNVNNDTFYPQEQEIQDGVGDGNFMRKDMVYDLVPDDHELVHWFVYLLRPIDHYIQGNLGGALNEAIADIVATLVRYLSWLLYGARLGDELTYEKLMHDTAVIGYYCFVSSDKGFREDNNNLVYPDDMHGTNVHDNARIPAAAMLHTFFALLDNAITVLQALRAKQGLEPMSKDQALQFVMPKAIKDFLRLIITAIPMLPAHDVTFSDWRKALEDSDRLISNGSHLAFIAQGFDRHKIKTNAVVLSRFAGYRLRR